MYQLNQKVKAMLWMLICCLPTLLLIVLFVIAININSSDSEVFLEYMKYAHPVMVILGAVGIITLSTTIIKLKTRYKLMSAILLLIHVLLFSLVAVSYLPGMMR